MTTIYLVESHIPQFHNDCQEVEVCITSLHAFLTRNCAENYVANRIKVADESLLIKEIPIA